MIQVLIDKARRCACLWHGARRKTVGNTRVVKKEWTLPAFWSTLEVELGNLGCPHRYRRMGWRKCSYYSYGG